LLSIVIFHSSLFILHSPLCPRRCRRW
jgi:hypothetical protein